MQCDSRVNGMLRCVVYNTMTRWRRDIVEVLTSRSWYRWGTESIAKGGVCVCGRCIYSDHSMWEGVYATLPIYNLLLLMDICSILRYSTAICEYNMQQQLEECVLVMDYRPFHGTGTASGTLLTCGPAVVGLLYVPLCIVSYHSHKLKCHYVDTL